MLSLVFGGCGKWRSPKVLRGYIILEGESLKPLASQSNAVCFLIVKDVSGVPVIIKRWLNPNFPLFYRLGSNELIVPTRPWDGPFYLEAYLFLSTNQRSELPPPADAVKTASLNPIEPEVMQNVILALKE